MYVCRHGLNKDLKIPRVILCVSDSTSDRQFAHYIYEDLCKANVPVELVLADDPTWFARCIDKDICVPILSEAYVMASWCEGKLTFAKDYGKKIVPIMADHKGYQHIMGRHSQADDSQAPQTKRAPADSAKAPSSLKVQHGASAYI